LVIGYSKVPAYTPCPERISNGSPWHFLTLAKFALGLGGLFFLRLLRRGGIHPPLILALLRALRALQAQVKVVLVAFLSEDIGENGI